MNDLLKVLTRSTSLQLLLLNLMAFSLGAGIAHYFGTPLPLPVYAAGQSISLALMLTAIYLREYFASFTASTAYPLPVDRAAQLTRKALQNGLLITALAFAILATTLVIIANRMAVITPLTIVLLITGVFGVLLIAIPSLRIMDSGAGEVILAFLLSLFIPAFAYSLASAEIHRYLLFISLSLAMMLVTTQMIHQFSTYAADCQDCRTNLLIRLGWQRSWHLHHILLILATVTLLIAGIQGLPWGILLPVAVTIPLAIWQVYLLAGMAAGRKPQWQIMRAISLAIPGLSLYLITFMFWVK
jgi:1,4-dihydroxy-2-naphthoate octaprenyltransferase